MSSKTDQFVHQCLAASGIALLHNRIAYRLRPDLWPSGLECAGDFDPRQIKQPVGARRYVAALEGFGRVELLARSEDRLAVRVGWITGYAVESLEPYTEPEKPKEPTIPRRTEAPPVDPYPEIVTAEPGRKCHDCGNWAGSACATPKRSGVQFPRAPDTPRRCLAYQAIYAARDERDGPTLWPEIVAHVATLTAGTGG